MIREDYVQSSATTRIFEKSLLDLSTINKLIDSTDYEEFKRILSDTSYGELANSINSRTEFDEGLDEEANKMYREFQRMIKDPELIEILTAKYTFHNLKTLLKNRILDEDLMYLILRVNDYDYEGIYSEIMEHGKVSKDKPFSEYVNKALEEYNDSKDPQRLDMQMDMFQYEYMLSLAKETNSSIIVEYVRNLIDAQNINMTLRAKQQNHRVNCVADFLIDGGNIPREIYLTYYFEDIGEIIKEFKSYNIYKSLEEALDRYGEDGKLLHFRQTTDFYLDQISIRGKKITYGPEVLFSYMLRKEREIRILRTIVIGKINDLTPDEIRERTGDFVA